MNLLLPAGGEVAHESRQSGEERLHGHHAHGEDPVV
jgi:hypothetical protein